MCKPGGIVRTAQSLITGWDRNPRSISLRGDKQKRAEESSSAWRSESGMVGYGAVGALLNPSPPYCRRPWRSAHGPLPQAGAVLEEMLAESPRDSTRAYNVLLNSCAKARKWEHAQKAFQVRGSPVFNPAFVGVTWQS